MKKNSLIKCLGMMLAASLVLTGCDSGGDATFPDGGGGDVIVGVTGGGSGGGAAAGTTGFGLTGGTVAGNFGGSGTTGGTGTTATGTTTGATTTTTTGATTTTGGFLTTPLTSIDLRTGLNNPTYSVLLRVSGQTRIFALDGYGLGVANGRLLLIDDNAATGPSGFPILEVQRRGTNTNPFTGSLTNPVDIATDGTNLYITTGFDSFGQGAVIRISNLSFTNGVVTGDWENITRNANPVPVNPAFLTLAQDGGGNVFVYWSEYAASGGGGSVRRVNATNASLPVDLIVNNLNFPAGIDHNGATLAICDQSSGGGNGRVITVPLDPGSTVDGGTAPIVAPQTGEQAIFRPFDIDYDGTNGFFFTEGGAFENSGAGLGFPGPTGQGNGALRFLPNNSTTAQLVSNGLTNCQGLDTSNINNDSVTAVAFTETVPINGRILRRLVDTNNVTNVAPTVADTGINRPLGVSITSETLPIIEAIINYAGGQSNGIYRAYGP